MKARPTVHLCDLYPDPFRVLPIKAVMMTVRCVISGSPTHLPGTHGLGWRFFGGGLLLLP